MIERDIHRGKVIETDIYRGKVIGTDIQRESDRDRYTEGK